MFIIKSLDSSTWKNKCKVTPDQIRVKQNKAIVMVVGMPMVTKTINAEFLHGVATNAYFHSNGVNYFDEVGISYCGTCNAWGGTPNSYTTDFHDIALLNRSSYCLPFTCSFNSIVLPLLDFFETYVPVVQKSTVLDVYS